MASGVLVLPRRAAQWNSTSLAKALSDKLKISVQQVFKRYGAVAATDQGPRKVLRVVVERGDGKKPLVAQWGGISLAQRMNADLDNQPRLVWNTTRTELERRLLANECELCGSTLHVEVHHIRHLKDLQRKGRAEKPEWVKKMAARCRKTLVVCRRCHAGIHAGRAMSARVAAGTSTAN